MASDFLVEVRDVGKTKAGYILPEHVSLAAEVPISGVGNWTLTTPLTGPMAKDLAEPGAGIVVTDRQTGEVLFSGPSTSLGLSYAAGTPGGALIVSGVTDEVVLQDSLAWPDPDNANEATQAVSRDTRTGHPATVIADFIDANIGALAVTERKNAYLVVERGEFPDADDIEASARFDNLLALTQGLCTGANYLFRVRQLGRALVFQHSPMGALSTPVRLDLYTDNLVSASVSVDAPTATRAFVGGDGTSTSRTFIEVTTADSTQAEEDWGRRIETFVSGTGTTLQLTTAGAEALAQSGATRLTARFEPNANMRATYGTQWELGDYAAITIGTRTYSSPINGLVIKADQEGLRIGCTLGEVIQTGNQIDRRVSLLETRP